MSSIAIDRPAASEYAPFYATYIARVRERDVLPQLEQQLADMIALLRARGEVWSRTRYAPGKWSVKEVIGHVSDAERIFAYRALRIARGDRTPLPGWEQDDYVAAAHSDARPLEELIAELASVRAATLTLLRSFDAEAWTRTGIANNYDVSVRALAYIIAGHAEHHLAIIRERY